jgi:DNA-binding transcriptional LysR family regulator
LIAPRICPACIADLEQTLGVRLLDRGPLGIEPTLYGSALVRRGLAVFDELRQAVREVEFMAGPTAGEVRIGCNESLSAALLPGVIGRLSEEYPGIIVHVAQMSRPILSKSNIYGSAMSISSSVEESSGSRRTT